MKTVLSFNDDELELANMAFNGAEAHSAIHAIDEQCRQWVKHYEITEKEEERLAQIREMCQGFDIS